MRVYGIWLQANWQTDKHTHVSCNAVPLMWGSLGLAPTKKTDMGLAAYYSSINISIEREHRLRPVHHLMKLLSFSMVTATCYIVSGALGGSGVVVGIQGVKASDNSVSALLLLWDVSWHTSCIWHCPVHWSSREALLKFFGMRVKWKPSTE